MVLKIFYSMGHGLMVFRAGHLRILKDPVVVVQKITQIFAAVKLRTTASHTIMVINTRFEDSVILVKDASDGFQAVSGFRHHSWFLPTLNARTGRLTF
jgi:hypothetical protein